MLLERLFPILGIEVYPALAARLSLAQFSCRSLVTAGVTTLRESSALVRAGALSRCLRLNITIHQKSNAFEEACGPRIGNGCYHKIQALSQCRVVVSWLLCLACVCLLSVGTHVYAVAYARRARAPPRESGADPRVSVEAIVVCHVSEITSK